MTGYVYAIECGDAVKIGYAKDPVRRSHNLRIGNASEMFLRGYVKATRAQEAELHGLLAHHRIRGEWFHKGHLVQAFLSLLREPLGRPSVCGYEPATTIVEALGGPSKVAAIVGIHPTRVSNWKRARVAGGTGGRIPQNHHRAILRAAQEMGLEITAETLLPAEEQSA
jgi:DNA-binding transcriptional regulator YdaS (Cro superfamily)